MSIALLFALKTSLHAQRGEAALSDAEIEQLRDAAYVPSDRVLVFVKFLDARTKSIQDLFAKPRRPGRSQDAHDLFEQFTAVADELDDNLDDYGPRHRDIRKALPKLLEATERWSSALKSPPDDEAYNVSRKLALESIRDIRETAAHLVEDQRAWFLAHPPAKENKNEPTTLPR
ncbi:hypothetical protein [Granulicella sp. dw_53]|uniref:hypothetical protein n=1 Tax=Granulicella sp. dw_53 TaxID=2719792 RepID=UPI002105ECF2|nr:hypothetical protein [Granulicella sp. dw_53]